MRAIIISVGSEFLQIHRQESNSLYIGRKLTEAGIMVDMKWMIGDDLENLKWAIKNAVKRSQLVVITGGLGPTDDDLTREAVAGALNLDLIFHQNIVDRIENMFKMRGVIMPEINKRQAFAINGAEILDNPLGTAPGMFIDLPNCKLVVLPGPPAEMNPMFDKVLKERIIPLCHFFIYSRKLRFFGISESELDSSISEIYNKYEHVKTIVLFTHGMIEVHFIGRGRNSLTPAQQETDEVAEKVKEKLKPYFFTEEDIDLPQWLVGELKVKNLTLAVAESCTGGIVGKLITDVPGSSMIFLGSVVAYANELKEKFLGIDEASLKKNGAVSSQTAKMMAQGICLSAHSHIGLAITGIAGPGGSTKEKPIGLVHFHIIAPNYNFGTHQIFTGDRNMIRQKAAYFALNLVREFILNGYESNI